MALNKKLHALLHFPLTRILIGALVVIGLTVVAQLSASKLFDLFSLGKYARQLLGGLVTASAALGSYIVLYKYYENRVITELSLKGFGRNLTKGIILGALLQSLTLAVMALAGYFALGSVNPLQFLIPALSMAFTSAIFEEILVRGIIFRIMEEKLGSYLALVISALIFGALHLGNPNSSLIAALGLALQAGFFLAAAFIYSRNLWFPIAIHFSWNFTQGGIFGANTSGNKIGESLFNTKIEGPEWISGGAFGPEGSIQATIFCFAAALILLFISSKKQKIVKPFWSAIPEQTN